MTNPNKPTHGIEEKQIIHYTIYRIAYINFYLFFINNSLLFKKIEISDFILYKIYASVDFSYCKTFFILSLSDIKYCF